MNTKINNSQEIPPILGLAINNETPFGDLYQDTFPEWYDVE